MLTHNIVQGPKRLHPNCLFYSPDFFFLEWHLLQQSCSWTFYTFTCYFINLTLSKNSSKRACRVEEINAGEIGVLPHYSWLVTEAVCFFVCLPRDCDVGQINYMYAQYVKNTMQPLNIVDVTKDQRFPWTVSTLSFVFPISFLHLLFSSFPTVSNYPSCPLTEWQPRSHQQPDKEFALHSHQEWQEGQSHR